MKRTFAILLCLMLTGCVRTMPQTDSGAMNQSLIVTPETTVSDTEPTATEMTEEMDLSWTYGLVSSIASQF